MSDPTLDPKLVVLNEGIIGRTVVPREGFPGSPVPPGVPALMVCSECGREQPATKFPTTDEAHRDTECRDCRDERRKTGQSPSALADDSRDRSLVPSSEYIDVTRASPGTNYEGSPGDRRSRTATKGEVLSSITNNASHIERVLDELETLYRDRDELYFDAKNRGASSAEIANAAEASPKPSESAPPAVVSREVTAQGAEEADALSERGAYPPTGAVAFYVDGRRVGVTQHTLSYMAGYAWERRKGGPRPSLRELTELLAEAGITDPYETEWTFTLPNTGRIVTTRYIPGRTLPDGRFIGPDGKVNPGSEHGITTR